VTDSLLIEVERSLCCPDGCKAVREGVPQDCAKGLTEAHAKAAIAVCGKREMARVRALIAIRDKATALADSIADTEDPAFQIVAREIAKLASDAL